jgi:deoxycytidylate deaminase
MHNTNSFLKDDAYWMRLVYEMAGRSVDPRTQIGAVLIDCVGNFLCAAHNHPVKNLDWGALNIHKNTVFDHAERRVIRNAAINYGSQSVRGATMYTQGIPCKDCARELVEWGITRLIVDPLYDRLNGLHSDYCQGEAEIMLRAAGIQIDNFGGAALPEIRYDGKTLMELLNEKVNFSDSSSS